MRKNCTHNWTNSFSTEVEKVKKQSFIINLKEEETIEDYFYVKSKTESVGKTGKPYLSLIISDKTGEMDARIWDNVEVLSSKFEAGHFVKLKGDVRSHQGRLQIAITLIERLDPKVVDIYDFFPKSEKDPAELERNLFKLIDSINDGYIRKLLYLIFKDPLIWKKFSEVPAAKSIHHAYIHGLLEHSVSVGILLNHLTKHYRGLNRDIMLAGGLLHDIGKIYELDIMEPEVYTLDGKLLGHIVEGVRIVDEKIKEIPDFPRKTEILIKHIIISHHGEKEAGSPVEPRTLEAVIVHLIDKLDASINSIRALLEDAKTSQSQWTEYNRFYSRSFFADIEEKREEEGITKLGELEELKKLKEILSGK